MSRRVYSPLTIDAAVSALAAAMEQINCQRRRNERVDVTPSTILVGEGTSFDSLFLLSFLVAAEERLAADHGLHLSLIDLVAEGEEHTPLKSIATLSEFLVAIAGAS